MWVRGLKFAKEIRIRNNIWSHPMWVRGLKYDELGVQFATDTVAPHVGAWIEMSDFRASASLCAKSHPMWVRGLK